MPTPLISVVIPTYNRKELLGTCLRALSQQVLPADYFEVIVADDGSTDGTESFLRSASYPFALRSIRTENGGPSRARNAGAGMAQGTYIAFTEDDVVVARDWLERALQYLRGEEGPDVLEGSTIYQDTKEPVRRFEKGLRHSFIPCNLFVRRSFFDQVGGYDPQFFEVSRKLYFREDADLGFRLLDAGARTTIAKDVIVEHPPQFADLQSALRHVRRYFFDPLLYKKHRTRFRTLIEVKHMGGVRLRRPQHYVALAYFISLVGLGVSLAQGYPLTVPFLAAVLSCALAFRFKYQGMHALRVYKIRETLGFFLVPLVYLAAVVRGCWKFKSWGVLL